MKLLRLSISQRLWLGLGLLLALFAAADLVSLRATHELDDTLSHLVSDGDARTGAAYEMNIHLDGTMRAVDTYLQNPEPAQRERIKAAQTKFERGLASYTGLAAEQQSRAIAAQVTDAYARYRKQTDELIRLTDAQSASSEPLTRIIARPCGWSSNFRSRYGRLVPRRLCRSAPLYRR